MNKNDDKKYCVYWSAEEDCIGDTRAQEWTTRGKPMSGRLSCVHEADEEQLALLCPLRLGWTSRSESLKQAQSSV